MKRAEILGWAGTAAVLGAYALASYGFVLAEGWLFQVLNLFGAIGLGTISYIKGVRQSVVLNIVWGGIALIALIRIAAA